jgi:insertion element IS1 protein InsB
MKMVRRIEKHCIINHLCTDANPVYGYYRLAKEHHVTKAETALVESWNCRLRHYLARLKRKTLCYSKCINALRNAIMMLIHKSIALSVFR